jgi:ABC-type lipoprotein export system ATPase subunit
MALKLKNLSKAFQDKEILNGFSYNFEESGLYFIVGESGVGKTTLLRIIAGLDREYDGTVENGGAENISFMFQEYRLFPTLGALKNAAISNENNIDKAHALLSRLGFEENDMKKKPRELSGGMKQRVAFARAVLKPAPILILDEPTKELDFETVATIHEVIAEEAKKRLVIVVTHDDITDFLTSASVIRL